MFGKIKLIPLFVVFLTYALAAQTVTVYKITVTDEQLAPLDSAYVTFGDTTKTTDSQGVALFYNPAVVSVGDEPAQLPETFGVSDAYPNPAEGDETRFRVKSEENVTIRLYNALGQKIASYDKPLRGNNTVTVRGFSGLAAGVYFAEVTDGARSRAVKLVNLNNGSGGSLSFNVAASPYAPQSAKPEEAEDEYIYLRAHKEGYADFEQYVPPEQTEVNVMLRDAYKRFAGCVYDNEGDSTGAFRKVKANVRVTINGESFFFVTDEQGGFDERLNAEGADMIDTVKVWNDSSYVQTYVNVPFEEDITDAGLFLTTYRNLNVTPELFYDFVMEVATREHSSPDGEEHIVSIDFQNAARDYVYWIDKDAAYTYVDSTVYDTLSNEEQHHIADVITERFYSHMEDSAHMPQFYFATNGEIPPLRPEGGFAYGVLFVTHKRGGNGYNYAGFNHDDDYLLDASQVSIGDPTDNDGFTVQEAASIISSRKGSLIEEIGGQSVFSEVNPTPYMTGIDIKLLHIEENIWHDLDNPEVTPIRAYAMPDGTIIKRFYYPTGVKVKHILGSN